MNDPLLYAKYIGVHKMNANDIIQNHIHLLNLKDNAKILDVGVGEGIISFEVLLPKLPTSFKQFVLLDISDKMLDCANNKIKDPRIDSLQLDISSDTVPVRFLQHFDNIFSFYCLNWVTEDRQTQALKNIFDMLKPGGTTFLIIVAKSPMFDIYENSAKSGRWAAHMHDVNEYISVYHHAEQPERKLKNFLEKVGFAVQLCKADKRVHVYPNWEYLMNFKLSLDPFLKNIPENESDHYVAHLEKELKTHKMVFSETCDGFQKFHVSYEFVVALASKPI